MVEQYTEAMAISESADSILLKGDSLPVNC